MTVEFFGVRHHSPTAARLVAERIRTDPPAAVLIEGPTEYNPHLSELAHDHTLPLMIYSWAPEGEGRQGVYYPLSSYSPEWLALSTAMKHEVPVRFIDAPFYLRPDPEQSPEHEDSAAVDRLLQELGVDDLDAAIDELIEIPSELSYRDYCVCMEHLGALLRSPDNTTLFRERFMADRIREMPAEGTALVICGAAHIEGLRAELERDCTPIPWSPPTGDHYGCALTPTSYAALDALQGYRAGQPNPGFYATLFDDRCHGRPGTAERLITNLIQQLREEKQRVSVADAIAVLTTARGLAALRGHEEIWRTDLLDAMTATLVKDDRGEQHPLVERIRALLRGSQVGALAAGSRRPPLVVEVMAQLSAHQLVPEVVSRVERIEMARNVGASQLLHSLHTLGISGIVLRESAERTGTETWELTWQPQFESDVVEAARYGAHLEDAVTTRLMEQLSATEDSPGQVARLMLDALLCGVQHPLQRIQERCALLLGNAGDIVGVGDALDALVEAYRFGDWATWDSAAVGDLIVAGQRRLSELLFAQQPASSDQVPAVVGALKSAVHVAERCADLPLAVDLWYQALQVTGSDRNQPAAVRGAAMAALWIEQRCDVSDITDLLRAVPRAEDIGDVVYGLLSLARELATRRPEFVRSLDETIAEMSSTDFLAALPGLRQAFAAYPPRERATIATLVLGEHAATAVQMFDVDAAQMAELAAFEERLARRLETFLGGKTR